MANWKFPSQSEFQTYIGSGTRGNIALTGAQYVLGSAGACVGFTWYSPTTSTITDVYWFVDVAPAEANNLLIDVTEENATYNLRPNTTAANKSVTGGTTSDVWIQFTLDTPYSVTAGKRYWVVVGDATTATSGYSILSRGGGYYNTGGMYGYMIHAATMTHTSGFNANGTQVANPAPCIVKYTDGTILGSNATETAGYLFTNNQLEHGIYIPSVPEDMYVIGCTYDTAPSTHTIRCYEDDAGPEGVGSIYSGFNGGSAVTYAGTQNCMGWPPCLLRKGHAYRFVRKHTSNNQLPKCSQVIGYGALADVLAADIHPFGVSWATQAVDATPDYWQTFDNATAGYYKCGMGLIVADCNNTRNFARASSLGGSLDL